jgi:hypothetical protein
MSAKNLLFARPRVLSAARARENWFWVSPSMEPAWASTYLLTDTELDAERGAVQGLPLGSFPAWDQISRGGHGGRVF